MKVLCVIWFYNGELIQYKTYSNFNSGSDKRYKSNNQHKSLYVGGVVT